MSSRALVAIWFVLMVIATGVIAWAVDADAARVAQWWAWSMVGLIVGKWCKA